MRSHHFLLLLCTVALLSCTGQALIQTGDEAYKYRQYPLAIDVLTEEIEESSDSGERAVKSYWIAESYRWQNKYDESLPWYRKAFELEQNQISLEAYAYALMRSQQYTNAEQFFTQLEKDYGRDERWTLARRSAQQAKKWIGEQKKGRYIIRRRPESSDASDFSVMQADGAYVVSSDRAEALGDSYHWTGRQHFDLFYDGDRSGLLALMQVVNTPLNESNLAVDPFDATAIWTRCGEADSDSDVQRCQLMIAELVAPDQWSAPEVIPFCEPNYSYGHPTWSPDGQHIIFSSNQPGGRGGRDLYIASRRGPAAWSEPRPLSNRINTAGDEVFPVWVADTLYFSSDGHIGMGGLDLYRCAMTDTAVTGRAQNLRPPINSGADDFGILPIEVPQDGSDVIRSYILASNRKGSRSDDLYQFDELRLATDPVPVEPEPKAEDLVVVEVYSRRGIGEDAVLTPLPSAKILREGEIKAIALDKDAKSTIRINESGTYTYTASAPDYFSAKKSIRVQAIDEENEVTYIVKLVLDPIDYGKEIVMEDIFYDFDKWDIREDARPSLDSLVVLLQDNQGLKIELSSHTDCRGLDIYNTELSQLRAQSAVTYLVNKGIDVHRLTAIGYGERQPRADCDCTDCTEDQHQFNRRTAFRVVR